MNENKRMMLLDWMRKIHQLEYAHCYQSIDYSKVEKQIGISAFVISTLVAFSYRFPTLEVECINTYLFLVRRDFVIPIALTVVAILTGLQTFLKANEKSENHKRIGFSYESLRHRIEFIITSTFTEEIADLRILEIRAEWENLDSIYVSDRNFIKGKVKVRTFNKYPKELDFLPDIN